MGRDIHVVLERKTPVGWEYFDPNFTAFDGRYYLFFDFLTKAGQRGCPAELKNRQLRPYTEHWPGRDIMGTATQIFEWDTTKPDYMHSFGYITLQDLKQKAKRLNCLWVSEEFLYMFYELGGKLPEEMEIATEAFDEDTKAVGVRVVDEDDLYLRDYINAGIAELEKIAAAQHLQDDELRMCYAFDC